MAGIVSLHWTGDTLNCGSVLLLNVLEALCAILLPHMPFLGTVTVSFGSVQSSLTQLVTGYPDQAKLPKPLPKEWLD